MILRRTAPCEWVDDRPRQGSGGSKGTSADELGQLYKAEENGQVGRQFGNIRQRITRTSQGMTLSAEAKSAKAAIGSAWMLQRTRILFK